MRIQSKDIGHVSYSKNPRYISSVIKVDNEDLKNTNINFSISDYNITTRTKVTVILEISFNKIVKNKPVNVGVYRMGVNLRISFDKNEIKKKRNLGRYIDYIAIQEAWPLFNSELYYLKNIRIYYDKLPPPPPEEFFQKSNDLKKK